MAASRALLRAAVKPRIARASLERLQEENVPDPPSDVADRHRCEEFEGEGARAVWLDRAASSGGVIVYLHGGGFVSGPSSQQWVYLSRLCGSTGAAGLMVDYPLAPQHPFPQALTSTRTLLSSLSQAGQLPPERWVLAGDSAGAALAISLACDLRDGGDETPLPRALVLSSPLLDLTAALAREHRRARSDPMLSLRGLDRDTTAYAAGQDLRDPRVSPLFGDPAGLPPMQVSLGTREFLLWENRAWRDKCMHAGVPIDYHEQRGGFHGYLVSAPFLPEARRAVERQAAFIASRLG